MYIIIKLKSKSFEITKKSHFLKKIIYFRHNCRKCYLNKCSSMDANIISNVPYYNYCHEILVILHCKQNKKLGLKNIIYCIYLCIYLGLTYVSIKLIETSNVSDALSSISSQTNNFTHVIKTIINYSSQQNVLLQTKH